MATNYMEHLDRKWTLGQAQDAVRSVYCRSFVELHDDHGTPLVVLGASYVPGEPPSRDSDETGDYVDWPAGSGVFVPGEVGFFETLWKLSPDGEELFDEEFGERLLAILRKRHNEALISAAVDRAGADGLTEKERWNY